MWSTKDVKDLLLLGSLVGIIIGAVGVTAFVMKKELDTLNLKKREA